MTFEQSRKTVLIVTDSRGGRTATQEISFAQPLEKLDAAAPFQVTFETAHSDPAAISNAFASQSPDLLVLSRYTSPNGVEWIAQSRNAGIPVIFHIDDDLLSVPESLGEAKFKAYNSPERLQALRENIESSDLLYVSTPELAKRFHQHGVRVPVIAGDLYCSVASNEIGALEPPATGPVIGYMGTAGHSADLAMILPAICEVMDAIPSLQFEVFGTIRMPPQVERFGSRVRHLAPVVDYANFIPFLRTLGWWVGLAPLEDNTFNRCKADTKWVEYSLAGMAVVASDLPVYHRACADGAGTLAASNADWSRAVYELVHKPQEREKMIEAAQTKLRKSYSREKLRAQVAQVFDQALRRVNCEGHVGPGSQRTT